MGFAGQVLGDRHRQKRSPSAGRHNSAPTARAACALEIAQPLPTTSLTSFFLTLPPSTPHPPTSAFLIPPSLRLPRPDCRSSAGTETPLPRPASIHTYTSSVSFRRDSLHSSPLRIHLTHHRHPPPSSQCPTADTINTAATPTSRRPPILMASPAPTVPRCVPSDPTSQALSNLHLSKHLRSPTSKPPTTRNRRSTRKSP